MGSKPRLRLLPLTLLITLAGCTTPKTVLEPVAVPCPKVEVSPELLSPPKHQAKDDLTQLLAPGSPSATPTKPN